MEDEYVPGAGTFWVASWIALMILLGRYGYLSGIIEFSTGLLATMVVAINLFGVYKFLFLRFRRKS